jgi:hypothetical protein
MNLAAEGGSAASQRDQRDNWNKLDRNIQISNG